MESNFQNRINFKQFEGKGFRPESSELYDSKNENSYNKSNNKSKYDGKTSNYYNYDRKNQSNNYEYFDK